MNKVLKKYQDRLNDVNRRNRSIRLSRIIKKKVFDLSDLKKIDENIPLKVINAIIHNNRKVNLLNTNVENKDEETVLRSILYLKRDIDFILNEKGYFECYLGYPFIQGNFQDGSFFRCPIMLYPVKIENNRQTKKLELCPLEDSQPIINKTFFLAFNKYNQGTRSVNLEELEEFQNLDRNEILPKIIDFFKTLNVNIINDNFSDDKIDSLKPLKQNEMPDDLIGIIELLSLAVIGQFNQLNSSLNKDYENILANGGITNDIFKKLMGDVYEHDLEEEQIDMNLIDQSEEDNFFLTKPDVYQEQVLIKSRKGDGLVIHGPPGTGKSQVIMNLISDNLLRNKKVLLVCEKRAALDVVYNRLASKSIHKYCLLVHDTQNDRNPIFKKISDTLEEFEIKEDGYLRTNNNEQTKKLAGEFDANLKHLKKIIDLIHEKNEFGTNLYTLYRKSRREDENILDLSNPIFDKITYDYINSAAHKISQIANLEYDFNSKEHPLYLRKPFLTDFDELKFKKDLKINIERFEKIETIFSKKDFSKDLELINSDNLTFDFLLEVVDSLEYLDEQKNSFFRFLNLKYIKNYLKYKPLSKNNYFSELLKKWTSIKNPLLDLIKSKEFFENFFHSKLYQELIANSLKFKQSSPVLKNILSSLKDVDKIIILDKTKSDFTKAEKEIMIGCREIYPNKINDIKLLWEELIKNSFYLKWINNKESKHIDLKKFSYNLYEELRNKMLSLLDDRQNLIPELIHEEFRNRYAKTKWAGFDRDGRRKNYNTHKSLIHEVNKKRMRVSIRKLVEKFGDGLLNLFPVWMCSPETVSNIFPLEKNLFDVIIFDEASQCKIERAMPAIIRGKKLIVAGDEKQLPPTTFFTTSIEEDNEEDLSDDEEDLLNDESLLVRSKSIFSGRRLLYHYRSKHPELINFSNHAFYNGNLKVIPRNEINVDSPIIYTQTKGLWEDRCNLVEAVEVAKLICNLLKSNDKGYTFGVITFNVNQMDAIEDAMEELAQKDPIFARLLDQEKNRHNQDEYIGLFVKNIENVQGDERDIIIFSVGYGFDNAGKFRYRFGPLNGMYGPNRLNVAISRAKHKSYVFTSFSPSDLKYEGKFEGPKLLGKYLAYCKAISDDSKKQSDSILNSLHESELSEVGFDNFDSDFEAEVKDALTELGYTVVTQAGCQGYSIDLAVIHPTYKNLFVVGIECDGEMYHSTKSAKDRDLYRQSVLESAGWNILRVWSRDWWIDSNKVIKRLDREIKVLALQTKPEKINLPKIKLQEEKNVITKKIEAKVREEIKQEIELDDLTLVCNSCLNEFKESESRNGRCPECGHNRSVVKFSGNTLR